MKTGFTLVEMAATLLLVGILAVSVTISLLPMSQALMQVRDNSAAAQKARLAMARIKHLCRMAPRNQLEQQLELEALYMPLSQETEESREGINAFLEKRAPDFVKLRAAR